MKTTLANHKPSVLDVNKFAGLATALEDFNDIRLLKYKADPQVDGVYLLLGEFRKDSRYCIFIYSVDSKELIEEPAELEAYGLASISKLYRKYPKHGWATV